MRSHLKLVVNNSTQVLQVGGSLREKVRLTRTVKKVIGSTSLRGTRTEKAITTRRQRITDQDLITTARLIAHTASLP